MQLTNISIQDFFIPIEDAEQVVRDLLEERGITAATYPFTDWFQKDTRTGVTVDIELWEDEDNHTRKATVYPVVHHPASNLYDTDTTRFITFIVTDASETGCKHPPTRLYSWFVGETLCLGCCECGAVLSGGAE